MIVTVKTRSGKSSKASFYGLYEYITRAGEVVETRLSHALDPGRGIPEQMADVVGAGTGRIRTTPAYHVIFSWTRPINASEAFGIVERGLDRLGVQDHQWVAALHRDADHIHVHVMVNRLHPISKRAWRPVRDYRTLAAYAKEQTQIERERGLVPALASDRSLKSSRAGDMEAWTGQLSLERWIRRDVLPDLTSLLSRKRATWRSFHRTLASHGLVIERTKQGMLLVDRTGKRPIRLAASSVGLGKSTLEARLGPFQVAHLLDLNHQHSYSTQRAGFNLPTAAMADLHVAPLWRAFIAEHHSWTLAGATIAALRRREIATQYREINAIAQQEYQHALSRVKTFTEPWKIASMIGLKRLYKIECSERRHNKSIAMAEIAMTRPATLFRAWLKKRERDGDLPAGIAVIRLRKGQVVVEDLSRIVGMNMSDITLDPLVYTLVERYLNARKNGIEFPLCRVGLAVQSISQAGKMQEYVAATALVRDQLPNEDRTAIDSALAAVVLHDTLPRDRMEELYRPVEQEIPLSTLLSLETEHVVETTQEQHDQNQGERGEISGIDPELADAQMQDLEQDALVKDAYARYQTYVDNFGGGLYSRQEALYAERMQTLDRQFKIKSGESRGASLSIAARLKAEAALQDDYETEREVIRNITGEIPPLDYATWLEAAYPEEEARKIKVRLSKVNVDLNIGFRDHAYDATLELARDLVTKSMPDGSVIHRWKGQQGFTDKGSVLSIVDAREHESAKLALLFAVSKFPDGIELTGTDIYIEHMLQCAVESGLESKIRNPELQMRIQEIMTQQQAEVKHGHSERPVPSMTERRQRLDEQSKVNQPPEFRKNVAKEMLEAFAKQLREEHPRPHEITVGIGRYEVLGNLERLLRTPNHCYALVGDGRRSTLTEIDPKSALALERRRGEYVHITAQEHGLPTIDIAGEEHRAPAFAR